MHIIRFEAQNIQRLSAVTIEPSKDSAAVVLAGGNEEGKSSCLDAIEMALAGERVMPPEPIRRGQERAQVVLDLGDMIVTRRFTSKGSSLTVTNREGLKYPSPQSLLEGFYNKLTFDPLAFAHAKSDEQAAILRNLAGVNTADLDSTRKQVFDQRTLINRDVAKARGAFERAEHFEDVGTEPQDVAAIIAALDDAERLALVLAEADRQLAIADGKKRAAEDRVRHASAAVYAARLALERAESELAEAETAANAAATTIEALTADRNTAKANVPDTSELRTRLAGVEAHNRKVEANKRRAELADEAVRVQRDAEALTKRIEELDASKAKRLASAKFPIDGLGLNDDGVTWNGFPFQQASTAIRTRVSVAIGFALHPKLRVLLVRNGNDLDAKNLKLLAEAAAEAGGQLWIERIAGGDGLQTIVIEDGAVKDIAPPKKPAKAQTTDELFEGSTR
jgi:DNA repair exonuclease SbcCD ATPase subunit